MSGMLKAENVTVRYGARTVVQDLSFELKEGEWLMLVGPNGAGKSTLIEAIAGGVPREKLRWRAGIFARSALRNWRAESACWRRKTR